MAFGRCWKGSSVWPMNVTTGHARSRSAADPTRRSTAICGLATLQSSPGAQEGFGRSAPAVRLVDWDHVGPGSFSYDLSTLMLRFPADERPRIISLYRAAAASNGIDIPADEDLHVLFRAAECARIACDATWTALVVAREGPQWALAQLAEINEWFERLQLPSPR
jgi:hypothetical protein